MGHYLSKALPLMVYPLGLTCILLSITLFLRTRERYRTWLVAISMALLWLSGNRLVSMLLLRSLEWRYLPPEPVPHADAIVVLGGATRMQTYPRVMHEMNEAGDRLTYAALLYREGYAPKVLLSGGGAPWDGPDRISEAEAMADLITMMGVPREALLLEERSRNTYENAVESAELLRAHGMESVLLVTSAIHMPRAFQAFAATGLTIIPAPVDYLFTQEEWDYFTQPKLSVQCFNLLPDAREFYFTAKVLKEYLGMATYRFLGRM